MPPTEAAKRGATPDLPVPLFRHPFPLQKSFPWTTEPPAPFGSIVRIPVGPTVYLLAVLALVLTAANLLALFLDDLLAPSTWSAEFSESFQRLFVMDWEANIPTWFSSILLVLVAFLLGVIGGLQRGRKDPYWIHWALLSLIFTYLSLDESAVIHEMGIKLFRWFFSTRGPLYYGWVAPALVLVSLLSVFCFRFLFSIPRKTRIRMFTAAGLYLAGALGFEMLSGWYVDSFGGEMMGVLDDRVLGLLTTVEESLELAGLIVFIHALLGYLSRLASGVTLVFASTTPEKGSSL